MRPRRYWCEHGGRMTYVRSVGVWARAECGCIGEEQGLAYLPHKDRQHAAALIATDDPPAEEPRDAARSEAAALRAVLQRTADALEGVLSTDSDMPSFDATYEEADKSLEAARAALAAPPAGPQESTSGYRGCTEHMRVGRGPCPKCEVEKANAPPAGPAEGER
jgi:hypothetical protein